MMKGLVFAAVAVLVCGRPAVAQEKASVAPMTIDKKAAKAGEKLFTTRTCNVCHTIGKGVLVGPDLAGVFTRRTPQWIRTWLKDPSAVLKNDGYAQALKEKYKIIMPTLGLTDEEITALMNYVADISRVSAKSTHDTAR